MFHVKLFFLASVVGVGSVNCILTKAKPDEVLDKDDIKKADNVVAESIDRDYVAGFDESFGHGLSAHAVYGIPEGNEGYGLVEASKHHIHHTQDHHHHHPNHHDHHKHYSYDHHKALAIKSLLVPLAGVALLGAAAAFVSNPILLQLGVISGTSLGRRKRDLNIKSISFQKALSREYETQLNHIKLLEKFMAQIPEQNIEAQEKKMLANYFSCSGATTKKLCLERLACELHSAEGISMPMEANVLTIVVNEILDNNFIPDGTKISLSKAIERGKKNFGCEIYECKEMKIRKD